VAFSELPVHKKQKIMAEAIATDLVSIKEPPKTIDTSKKTYKKYCETIIGLKAGSNPCP